MKVQMYRGPKDGEWIDIPDKDITAVAFPVVLPTEYPTGGVVTYVLKTDASGYPYLDYEDSK